jgi:sporulation integral membrane protein YtvI
VASIIHPLAKKTQRRLRLPYKLCAAVYVALLLLLLSALLFFLISRLTEELRELVAWVEDHQEQIVEKIGVLFSFVERLSERFSFMKQAVGSSAVGESVDVMVSDWISKSITSMGTWITAGVGRMLLSIPKALILLLITVMACFYWSMDYTSIQGYIWSVFPRSMQVRAEAMREKARSAFRRYIRAYVILWCLTFCEVLIGLLLLKQPYAFLISALVATVDILPVLGAGTILIPWAIMLMLLGNYTVGSGLLVLYGVLTIVRQIAEPRIVGESLGLHPLASLLCIVLGLQLFGVFGMIFAIPLTAVIYTLLRDMANAKEEKNKPMPVEEVETVEEMKEDESETDE